MKKYRIVPFITIGLIFILTMVACGATEPTPTSVLPGDMPGVADTPGGEVSGDTPEVSVPTETLRPTVEHVTMPAEPPGAWLSEITDRDTSPVAAEKRALGGENYSVNLFERPFNATMMDKYFPDLDITRARLFEDSQWVYVTIRLVGVGDGGVMGGSYGVEVDLDVDGRGDLLVFADAPQAAWSTDSVRLWVDDNNDVGGANPVISDSPGGAGDGYETLIFDDGYGDDPDLAWSRVSPEDPASVQIAFKLSLLNNDSKFTWGAWADRSILNPEWFDYDDHFTPAEAGSPLVESADYPLKALYELDNTCRWSVGFIPTGTEPGICPVPATPTPVMPGSIEGTVYHNGLSSSLALTGTSMRLAGKTVRARSGDCASPGAVVTTAITNRAGYYKMTVSAGTYCLDVYPETGIDYDEKTPPQTVTVSPGQSIININFGFRQEPPH
jgi:hypothetical protein